MQGARLICALTAALLALSGCAGRYFQDAGAPPDPPQLDLAAWPYREYWTAIVFNGNKIGYAHVQVTPAVRAGEPHEIRAESALRLRFLGFDKRVTLWSYDRVRDDLSLESFEYQYDIDGARLALVGRVEGDALHVRVTNAGRLTELTMRPGERVYPASAIAMVPALRGLKVGVEHVYPVFSGEAQRVAPVTQRVEAYERSTLFEGAAWKVATEMLGLRTTTWIDARARPLLDIGLGGVIIAGLENEARAKRDLTAGALNQGDALLDLAVIRLPEPLGDPRALTSLKLAIGVPAGTPTPPTGNGQRCGERGGRIECELRAVRFPDAEVPKRPAVAAGAYLKPSLAVPSEDAEIRALAARITGGHADASAQVEAILAWMRANIGREPADVFSALDVLRSRRAECQGHAYLYAALARALGIPTRVANGLVYSPELQGFAYHTWNESLLDGEWIGVDATLGQLRTDATHLGIVYGENPGDLAPLAAWIGRTRIEVLERR
jgi:hypothetical protein